MKKIKANFFHNEILVYGEISYEQKIKDISILGEPSRDSLLLLPGFIDLHVHGGGGHDFMEGTSAIKNISETHFKFGTTSYLATTMTAPHEELVMAFNALKNLYEQKTPGQSRMLGIHLEGPFISSEKLGAQPDFTREATLKEIKELHNIVPIKIITLAPELFNHLGIIKDLKKLNITVQIGHTNGSYEEGIEALNQGATSFTHLFNAMSTFHHRSPGMVGAALAHADYAEIIPDLLHVHPGAIKAALRSIPNLYFVTDSTAASGMPDGDYKLGVQTVHKCLGGVRLKDGTLAGSALTMDQALRNLSALGLSTHECSLRLSTIPGQLIKETKRGEIKTGFFADFILMENNFKIVEVISEGEAGE